MRTAADLRLEFIVVVWIEHTPWRQHSLKHRLEFSLDILGQAGDLCQPSSEESQKLHAGSQVHVLSVNNLCSALNLFQALLQEGYFIDLLPCFLQNIPATLPITFRPERLLPGNHGGCNASSFISVG